MKVSTLSGGLIGNTRGFNDSDNFFPVAGDEKCKSVNYMLYVK